jgi:hypothetical protein
VSESSLEALKRDGFTRIVFPRMGKVRRFVFIFCQGIYFRYPLCCVLRFSFEHIFLDGKEFLLDDFKRLAAERGSVRRGPNSCYVPCNIFHHKTEDC